MSSPNPQTDSNLDRFCYALGWLIPALGLAWIAKNFLESDFTAWDMSGHFNVTLDACGNYWPWLSGWNSRSFMGYAQGYFYPPFFSWLACGTGKLLGIEAGFRTVVLTSIALLPIGSYAFLRSLGLSNRGSQMGMLWFLFFLLASGQSGSSLGGMIPATFVGGLVSAQLAFALFFLYLAALIKGLKDTRFLAAAGILLGLVVLTHGYVALMAYVSSAAIFFTRYFQRGPKMILFYALHVLAFIAIATVWQIPYIGFKHFYTSGLFANWMAFTGVLTKPYSSALLIGTALAYLNAKRSPSSASRTLVHLFLANLGLYLFFREFPDLTRSILKDSPIQTSRFGIPILGFAALLIGQQLSTLKYRNIVLIGSLAAFSVAATIVVPEIFKIKRRSITVPLDGIDKSSRGLVWAPNMGVFIDIKAPHLLPSTLTDQGYSLVNGLFIESSRTSPYVMTALDELTPDTAAFTWFSEWNTFNPKAYAAHLRYLGVRWILTATQEISQERKSGLAVTKSRELPLTLNVDGKNTELKASLYEMDNPLAEFLTAAPKAISFKEDWKTIADDWWKDVTPSTPVIIRTDAPPPEFSVPSQEDRVSAAYENSEKINLKIKASGPRWVYLKIAHFPHWKAYQGAQEIPVFHAGGNMMVVRGFGDITLRFERPARELALYWISGGTITLLLLWILYDTVRRRRPTATLG